VEQPGAELSGTCSREDHATATILQRNLALNCLIRHQF
jgi:hypothetical protein